MVARPSHDFSSFGYQPSADGWFTNDVELIDLLAREGSFRANPWLFWLKRDAGSPKTLGIWSGILAAFTAGVLWRDPIALLAGLLLGSFYLRLLKNMVTVWSGKLQTGIVRGLEPHPAPGIVAGLLDGQSTRVAMEGKAAEAALQRLGPFEVMFFAEDNPKAYALALAFRPVRVPPPR